MRAAPRSLLNYVDNEELDLLTSRQPLSQTMTPDEINELRQTARSKAGLSPAECALPAPSNAEQMRKLLEEKRKAAGTN